MSPKFFLIGAPRCGSYSIAKWLSRRKDVYLPKTYGIHRYAAEIEGEVLGRSAYNSLYKKANAPCIGEASVWYLSSETAIDSILADQPNAKFVVCLRNPVDMAWLLHQQFVASQYEHFKDFNTAWAMSHLRGLGRGSRYLDPRLMDYASVCSLGSQVQSLLRKVPSNQVCFIVYDDLQKQPRNELAKLEKFLGISSICKSKFKLHEALYMRPLPGLHTAMKRLHILQCKFLGTSPVRPRILKWVDSHNKVRSAITKMPDDLRMKLSFRMQKDIKLLSSQIGKDLSHWCSDKATKA